MYKKIAFITATAAAAIGAAIALFVSQSKKNKAAQAENAKTVAGLKEQLSRRDSEHAALGKKRLQDIARLNKEHEKAMADLEKQHKEDIRNIKNSFRKNMSDMDARNTEKTAELTAEIAKANKRYEQQKKEFAAQKAHMLKNFAKQKNKDNKVAIDALSTSSTALKIYRNSSKKAKFDAIKQFDDLISELNALGPKGKRLADEAKSVKTTFVGKLNEVDSMADNFIDMSDSALKELVGSLKVAVAA